MFVDVLFPFVSRLIVLAGVLVVVGVVRRLFNVGSLLVYLIWFVYFGFVLYLFSAITYFLGAGFEVFLYVSSLLGSVTMGVTFAFVLHVLSLVGKVYSRMIGVSVLILFAVPLVASMVFFGSGAVVDVFLAYHLMVAGFVFWMFSSYVYGVVGRFELGWGMWSAVPLWAAGFVYAGAGVLFLYVVGGVLSGLFNQGVYGTYFELETVMSLIGTVAGIYGVTRISGLRTRPEGETVLTGVEGIDREIGLRFPSVVAVVGPTGSGRSTLLARLTAHRLSAGDGVVMLSLHDTLDELRSRLAGLGCDVDRFEKEGRLILLTSLAPAANGQHYVASEPNEINIAFTRVLSKLATARKWFILDSITPVMENHGVEAGLKLLNLLVAKSKAAGVSFWITYNNLAFPQNVTALVMDSVDGVVETMLKEENGRLSRMVRVFNMKDVKVSGTWYKL
ncbi:MAG: RAD55 family ATPase [Candidatus Caldarchaeum sp.]